MEYDEDKASEKSLSTNSPSPKIFIESILEIKMAIY
jgi:hypothetical protein